MDTVTVRAIADDVDAALAFYRDHLGFEVLAHPAPGFAMLGRGGLRLLLNAPGAGGAGRPARDGRLPTPGGWTRIVLTVEDLDAAADALRDAGVRFRTDVVEGNGGWQVLVEDPSGNPVELLQPAVR